MGFQDDLNAIVAAGQTASNATRNMIAAIDAKPSVRLMLTVPDSLSGLAARQSLTLAVGDRIAVSAQANPVNNGVWIAQATAWRRASDFSDEVEITPGAFFFVEEGTYSGQEWIYPGPKLSPGDVGAKALTFVRKPAGPSTGGVADVATTLSTVKTMDQATLDKTNQNAIIDAAVVENVLKDSLMLTMVSVDKTRRLELWSDKLGNFKLATSTGDGAGNWVRQKSVAVLHTGNADPWRHQTQLPSTADLNNVKTPGYYNVVYKALPNNWPTQITNAGVVLVFTSEDGNLVSQQVWDYETNQTVGRFYSTTNGWSQWATVGNVDWTSILNRPTSLAGYGIRDQIMTYRGQMLLSDDLNSTAKFGLSGFFTLGGAVTVDKLFNCPFTNVSVVPVLEVYVSQTANPVDAVITQRITDTGTAVSYTRQKVAQQAWGAWVTASGAGSLTGLLDVRANISNTSDADGLISSGVYYVNGQLQTGYKNFPTNNCRVVWVTRSPTVPVGVQMAYDVVSNTVYLRSFVSGAYTQWVVLGGSQPVDLSGTSKRLQSQLATYNPNRPTENGWIEIKATDQIALEFTSDYPVTIQTMIGDVYGVQIAYDGKLRQYLRVYPVATMPIVAPWKVVYDPTSVSADGMMYRAGLAVLDASTKLPTNAGMWYVTFPNGNSPTESDWAMYTAAGWPCPLPGELAVVAHGTDPTQPRAYMYYDSTGAMYMRMSNQSVWTRVASGNDPVAGMQYVGTIGTDPTGVVYDPDSLQATGIYTFDVGQRNSATQGAKLPEQDSGLVVHFTVTTNNPTNALYGSTRVAWATQHFYTKGGNAYIRSRYRDVTNTLVWTQWIQIGRANEIIFQIASPSFTSTDDLNTKILPGVFYQAVPNNAKKTLNYPEDTVAGVLMVSRNMSDSIATTGVGQVISQTYTTANAIYTRWCGSVNGTVTGGWTQWVKMAVDRGTLAWRTSVTKLTNLSQVGTDGVAVFSKPGVYYGQSHDTTNLAYGFPAAAANDQAFLIISTNSDAVSPGDNSLANQSVAMYINTTQQTFWLASRSQSGQAATWSAWVQVGGVINRPIAGVIIGNGGSDLNQYVTPGDYYGSVLAAGQKWINCPTPDDYSGALFLEVRASDTNGTNIRQVLTMLYQGVSKRWERYTTAGSTSAWSTWTDMSVQPYVWAEVAQPDANDINKMVTPGTTQGKAVVTTTTNWPYDSTVGAPEQYVLSIYSIGGGRGTTTPTDLMQDLYVQTSGRRFMRNYATTGNKWSPWIEVASNQLSAKAVPAGTTDFDSFDTIGVWYMVDPLTVGQYQLTPSLVEVSGSKTTVYYVKQQLTGVDQNGVRREFYRFKTTNVQSWGAWQQLATGLDTYVGQTTPSLPNAIKTMGFYRWSNATVKASDGYPADSVSETATMRVTAHADGSIVQEYFSQTQNAAWLRIAKADGSFSAWVAVAGSGALTAAVQSFNYGSVLTNRTLVTGFYTPKKDSDTNGVASRTDLGTVIVDPATDYSVMRQLSSQTGRGYDLGVQTPSVAAGRVRPFIRGIVDDGITPWVELQDAASASSPRGTTLAFNQSDLPGQYGSAADVAMTAPEAVTDTWTCSVDVSNIKVVDTGVETPLSITYRMDLVKTKKTYLRTMVWKNRTDSVAQYDSGWLLVWDANASTSNLKAYNAVTYPNVSDCEDLGIFTMAAVNNLVVKEVATALNMTGAGITQYSFKDAITNAYLTVRQLDKATKALEQILMFRMGGSNYRMYRVKLADGTFGAWSLDRKPMSILSNHVLYSSRMYDTTSAYLKTMDGVDGGYTLYDPANASTPGVARTAAVQADIASYAPNYTNTLLSYKLPTDVDQQGRTTSYMLLQHDMSGMTYLTGFATGQTPAKSGAHRIAPVGRAMVDGNWITGHTGGFTVDDFNWFTLCGYYSLRGQATSAPVTSSNSTYDWLLEVFSGRADGSTVIQKATHLVTGAVFTRVGTVATRTNPTSLDVSNPNRTQPTTDVAVWSAWQAPVIKQFTLKLKMGVGATVTAVENNEPLAFPTGSVTVTGPNTGSNLYMRLVVQFPRKFSGSVTMALNGQTDTAIQAIRNYQFCVVKDVNDSGNAGVTLDIVANPGFVLDQQQVFDVVLRCSVNTWLT